MRILITTSFGDNTTSFQDERYSGLISSINPEWITFTANFGLSYSNFWLRKQPSEENVYLDCDGHG